MARKKIKWEELLPPTDMSESDGKPRSVFLHPLAPGRDAIKVHWIVWDNVGHLLLQTDLLTEEQTMAYMIGNSTGQAIRDPAMCRLFAAWIRDLLKDYADDQFVWTDDEGTPVLGTYYDTWEETAAHKDDNIGEDEELLCMEAVEIGPVRKVCDFLEHSGGFEVRFE